MSVHVIPEGVNCITYQMFSKMNKVSSTFEECAEHEFEFVPCLGTFCQKCNIPFGLECVHPNCKIHNCQQHMLLYQAFEQKDFGGVLKDMTNDIYLLHLGHDGVQSGKDEEIRAVLNFKGLKVVEYCGYYTDNNVTDIFEEPQYQHITFCPIY